MSAVMQQDLNLTDMKKSLELVHVLVNDIDVYIPLHNTIRIVPIVNLLPVPSGPDYLKGLMSLAGNTIPVVDLGERLGIYNSNSYTIDTLILICHSKGKTLGLIIDDIFGLELADQKQIQLQHLFGESEGQVIAVVNTEQGISLLLDMEKVFDIVLTVDEEQPLDVTDIVIDKVVE